jgi:2-keto-4-pentenoate hydratase
MPQTGFGTDCVARGAGITGGRPAGRRRDARTRTRWDRTRDRLQDGARSAARTDGAQHTRAAVIDAIASAHAAIEICVCRLADFDSAAPLDRLADGIMNEGLVVGPACTSWRALTLSQLPLRVDIDGITVHQGIGGHPIGDPLIPLVWVANHLAARGITLHAGALVTTGSCNGIRYIERGQQIEVGFAGLGQASICW